MWDTDRPRASVRSLVERHGPKLRASPVVLAGAARAVRGVGQERGGKRRHDWAPLLCDAADRVATSDVYVRWLAGVVASTWMCTAHDEILAILEELPGPEGGGLPQRTALPARVLDPDRVRRVRVQDQSGTVLSLADLLSDRTTLLAFFYTRCMNPT